MKIHFVYVKGDLISTPFAITNEVARRLRLDHEVIVYDWLERRKIDPEPGDILIGHVYPSPGTIYWESFADPRFSRRYLLQPYAHGIPRQMAFLDRFVTDCDAYFAICGRYWFDTVAESWFAHWKPKMVHLDLALNRDHYPFVKRTFNRPGQRRFLNIGRVSWYKGTDYLAALADDNPDLQFTRIGPGKMPPSRVTEIGERDFSTPEGQALIAEYDFLIAPGRSDANPTTILEAAAWGLPVIATPQSGYVNTPWITNLPLDDLPKAKEILNYFNHAPELSLREVQWAALEALDMHFHWDRFVDVIRTEIQGPSRNNAQYRETLLAPGVVETQKFLARVTQIELTKDRTNRAIASLRYYGSRLKARLQGILRRVFNKS